MWPVLSRESVVSSVSVLFSLSVGRTGPGLVTRVWLSASASVKIVLEPLVLDAFFHAFFHSSTLSFILLFFGSS